jgi:predicted nuclease with TOPRIM domain
MTKPVRFNRMTENELTYVKIEATGFQDICNKLAELEKQNKELILENERLQRMLNGVKLNNGKLTIERNELLNKVHFLDQKCKAYHQEVLEIISMDMWEFANNYCSDKQLEEAGHALARSFGIGGK